MEKRNVNINNYKGPGNSLKYWYRIIHPLKLVRNVLVVNLCKRLPSMSLKNHLYRSIGVKIGKNVTIAYGVTLDFFFPELIEIHDNTIIGYESAILTHEFLNKEWRKGKVLLEKDSTIGAWCLVMPGSEVGEKSTVASYSLVNKKVPKNTTVGGIPVKKIKSRT